MRGVVVAALMGAGAGAAVSVTAFLAVSAGTHFYFRAVSRRETRREKANN